MVAGIAGDNIGLTRKAKDRAVDAALFLFEDVSINSRSQTERFTIIDDSRLEMITTG